MITISFVFIGVALVVEAVVQLVHKDGKGNRLTEWAWTWTAASILGRVMIGVYLMIAAAIGQTVTLDTKMTVDLGNWLQTATQACITFLSVRYVGRVVERVEKNRGASKNGNGKLDQE